MDTDSGALSKPVLAQPRGSAARPETGNRTGCSQMGTSSTAFAALPMASLTTLPATGTIEMTAPASRRGTLTSFVRTTSEMVATKTAVIFG
jgi:hypothetical protein